MSRFLGRLGGWCARHGRLVLALWVIAAAVLMGGSIVLGSPVSNDASIPGTDAQRAHDLMRDGFGPGYDQGGTVQLVIYSPHGPLTDDGPKRAVKKIVLTVRHDLAEPQPAAAP